MEKQIDCAGIMEEITQDAQARDRQRHIYDRDWQRETQRSLEERASARELVDINSDVCHGIKERNHLIAMTVGRLHQRGDIQQKDSVYQEKGFIRQRLKRFVLRIISEQLPDVVSQQNQVNQETLSAMELLQASTLGMADWSTDMEQRINALNDKVRWLENRQRAVVEEDAWKEIILPELKERLETKQCAYEGCPEDLISPTLTGSKVDLSYRMDNMCSVDYLKTLADKSVRLLTGFSLVEYLEFPGLLELFDEVQRVLNVGGAAIFDATNVESKQGKEVYFYPPYRNPVHPELLRLLGERLENIQTEIVKQEQGNYVMIMKKLRE